eukprot:m.190437 g.190437  ORF g.190437 m.190437 type:complete len:331 (-) comp14817_c0_seq6:454-1446(-)
MAATNVSNVAHSVDHHGTESLLMPCDSHCGIAESWVPSLSPIQPIREALLSSGDPTQGSRDGGSQPTLSAAMHQAVSQIAYLHQLQTQPRNLTHADTGTTDEDTSLQSPHPEIVRLQAPILLQCGPAIEAPQPLSLPSEIVSTSDPLQVIAVEFHPVHFDPAHDPSIIKADTVTQSVTVSLTPCTQATQDSTKQPREPQSPRDQKQTKGMAQTTLQNTTHTSKDVVVPLFSCELCRRSFKQRSNLIIHSKVHSKQKMFACPVCGGRKFKHSNSMRKHVRSHHPEQVKLWGLDDKSVSQFPCLHCSKVLPQFSELSKHCMHHFPHLNYQHS